MSSSHTPVHTPVALGPRTYSLHDAGCPQGCPPELHSHSAVAKPVKALTRSQESMQGLVAWLTVSLFTDSRAVFTPAASNMPCLPAAMASLSYVCAARQRIICSMT